MLTWQCVHICVHGCACVCDYDVMYSGLVLAVFHWTNCTSHLGSLEALESNLRNNVGENQTGAQTCGPNLHLYANTLVIESTHEYS